MTIQTKTTHVYVCDQCDREETREVGPSVNAEHVDNLPDGWSRLEVIVGRKDFDHHRYELCSNICVAKQLQMIGDDWEQRS